MNERDEQELDRLLGELPSPDAPSWFKQRTLNRLREERGQQSGFSTWLARFSYPRLATLAAAAAVLLVAGLFFSGERDMGTEVAAEVSLDSALDAFVSFTEESSEWGGDPFL